MPNGGGGNGGSDGGGSDGGGRDDDGDASGNITFGDAARALLCVPALAVMGRGAPVLLGGAGLCVRPGPVLLYVCLDGGYRLPLPVS